MNNYDSIFTEYPDVVSIDELQEMLKIGRNSAYSMLNDGSIKAGRVGKRFIIPKMSVINYLNSIA